ncbi:spermatogenesis-associated protein 7 homolog [Kryptolebias marmoratus]|uniref:Spermatogenesis associated 7 n=1 Tax=Kryptolebias marmoratus TaxID=37003 RepID=A0A3Q3ADU6_KRYMA|nr:spermatogenesis-associated protein 7 homolog [Kryptolebias marmoratus]
MGFADFNTSMESRTGSGSSGLGSSSGLRGQTLKSSPFCPRSSSKLTQSIIKDHMVSHYRMIYSAKAAIDTSVPKSLLQSVKYNDQIRKERLRKGLRPHSALSFSQRNGRTSRSSSQSQLSVQCDDSPYLCSRSSIISSPRFTTSFNAKDVVYPSCKVGPHRSRPSSEMKYRSPDETFQRKQSTCSLVALRDQGGYKTFQDPVKKTYSGDLLQKHSQHFTQEKPFTPKTLKSDKSSYLTKYRFYRAPLVKPPQDGGNSGQMQQDTSKISTKIKKHSHEPDEQSEEYSTDREWLEDELNCTYFSPSDQQDRKTKRDHYLFGSTSRISPEGRKPLTRSRVSAEEEELMYLEFIATVTEDILSRGHISNSMVDRVMKRHIGKNLHRLDEGKMRHLLEELRKELDEPTNVSSRTETDSLDTVFSHLDSGWDQVKTKEGIDPLSHETLINSWDLPRYDDPFLVSTPLSSPVRKAPSPKIIEEKKSDMDKKGSDSALLSDELSNSRGDSRDTAATRGDENEHADGDGDLKQGDVNLDGEFKVLEDLEMDLSEKLHVSRSTHSPETANGTDANSVASVSDDDF